MATEARIVPNENIAVINVIGGKDASAMDRIFRYLSRRGIIVVALIHPAYRALRLLREYASGSRLQLDFQLMPLGILAWVRLF